jgi:ribulose-phosphate 3-epimerase
MTLFHPDLTNRTHFFYYRYRLLFNYIIIGALSLVLEIVVFWGLENLLGPLFAKLTGLCLGVLFAFWVNVRYNFKIPKGKRNKAFLFFISISALSVFLNLIFRKELEELHFSYGQARFLSAGLLFLIAYALHRKYSFKDFKKVSVAIYANGVEDIESIHKSVGSFPDIIHIDIVDHTFGKEDHDTRTYRLEVVKAYWPHKPMHVHLMSKTPSVWIEDIAKYADLIIFHYEIDEDILNTIELIKSKNCMAGLALMTETPIESVLPFVDKIDTLMLLTIPRPGMSGQSFEISALKKIETLNSWPERADFDICIDGGVNEKIIGLLNVETVVSGSSVLCHENPPRQIMRLKTSSSYEQV